MTKTYLIDVMVRGQPEGVTAGEEPVVTAIRVSVEVPEVMTSQQRAGAIGEEVRKIGLHFIANTDQLGINLDRYEEALEEDIDYADVPPEFRPN